MNSSLLTKLLLALILGLPMLSPRAAGQSCPGFGDCLVYHASPGCASMGCCSETCATIPSCCSVSWDSACVDYALSNCELCGSPASGSCLVTHMTPSCDDAACCGAVCSIDPFCCAVRWDAGCAFLAGFSCVGSPGTCGDPSSGPCNTTHPSGACADQDCCEAVCDADPSCCSSSWDGLCVAHAASLCDASCVVAIPSGSTVEIEVCGLQQNDPCVAGSPLLLGVPGSATGTFANQTATWADSEVVRVELADTNGDGEARLTINLASEGASFALVLPAGFCDSAAAIAIVESPNCSFSQLSTCLPGGTYDIRISPGTATAPLIPGPECANDVHWVLTVQSSDPCQPPPVGCPGTDGCFAQHLSPGCSDVTCCSEVCSIDALCCAIEWDMICVTQAAVLCDLPPPTNDDCTSALPLPLGSTAFSTLGATAGGPSAPANCTQSANLGPDVWFSVSGLRGTYSLSTCPSHDFDSVIVVYEGTCLQPIDIACGDDSPFCIAKARSAELEFVAQCSKTYLVRVASTAASSGNGVLTLTPVNALPCSCSGDFDASGAVDGSDLASLLGSFGYPSTDLDLDGDGVITGADLSVLLAAWGNCP